MELGLSVGQALSMGVVNKCFDEDERRMVQDVISLRISSKMTAASVFDRN